MTSPAGTVIVCVALGANQGDRLSQLRTAYDRLNNHPAIDVVAASPTYVSEAHTLDASGTAPYYLNAVVQAETVLSPETLLNVCQAIERGAGRDRREEVRRWAPRRLDLDILTYGQHQIDTAALTIPHPRLGERRFVLQPWSDIAPNLYVPSPFNHTVQELLAQCSDAADLRRTSHSLESTSSAPT